MNSQKIVTAFLLAATCAMLNISAVAVAQNAPVVSWNVKAPPYDAKGDKITDDTAAFNSIINDCPAEGCRIYIPDGTYVITSTLNIPLGKSISFIGQSKNNTMLHAVGSAFSLGQPMISYSGTDPKRFDSVEISNLALNGSGPASGLSLTWVVKSRIESVLFTQMTNGVLCAFSFTNTFSNNNSYSLFGDTYQFGAECNNNTILGGAFGSAHNGIHVTAGLNGLTVIGSNCEDILAGGYCLYLSPPSGARVDGVSVQNTHFEGIRGAAVYANGVDASSVLNLKFDNNLVAGGYHDYYGQQSNYANYALILKNVSGFEANNNVFYDWRFAAFIPDGTESNGGVEHNMLVQPVGNSQMSLANPIFRPSVRTTNNAAWIVGSSPAPVGRQEIFRSTIPNVGSCNVGDIAWNTAPALNAYAGWVCVTAGSPGVWKRFGLIQ